MRWKLGGIGIVSAALAVWMWRAGATERAVADRSGWETLPSGLELGVFPVDPAPRAGDGRIVVVRVDPDRFALRIRAASVVGAPATAAAWLAEDAAVLAAVNTSMYQRDGRTSTGLLVVDGVANNGALSKDNAVLTFGAGPPRLVDRTCEALPEAPNAIQGIRMLGCGGENVWAPQPNAWSEAALGEDADGNTLLVFARTPWPMHEFVERVRGLGIGVTRLQHAEGGPPAQLAFRDGARVAQLVGSYETDVRENDGNGTAMAVPNLLGVVAR
jgi:hypothetical protein